LYIPEFQRENIDVSDLLDKIGKLTARCHKSLVNQIHLEHCVRKMEDLGGIAIFLSWVNSLLEKREDFAKYQVNEIHELKNGVALLCVLQVQNKPPFYSLTFLGSHEHDH